MRLLRYIRLQRHSRTLAALAAVIFIYTFATSILQYNLALFTDSLAPSYTLFGIVMGLPWFFSLLTDMPTGALADRFGRKRTIVLGLTGLGASGLFFYFTSGLFELFWVLVLFGTFEGFLTVAGMASVIAASPHGKEHQFVGGYTSASAFGYVVGPLAGGAAAAWFGGRVPFLIFGFICFVAAAVAHLAIREPARRHDSLFLAIGNVLKKDHVYLAELREFFSAGRVAFFVSFCMLLVGMWGEFIWAMEPILIASIHTSPLIGGLVLTAFVVPFALLDYPLGRWLDRTQKRFATILTGLIVGGTGIVLFSIVSSILWLTVFAAIVSAGFALFYVAVNGIFDSFSDHHRRGYMTGVWQSSEDIGFVLGPVIGGMLADVVGLSGAFRVFGVVFLLSILWVLWERKTIQQYETEAAR